MDDEVKAALARQLVQMEALSDAMLSLRHRLDALTGALGALDRSVHQTHAVSLSVRDRIKTLDQSVQCLASAALGGSTKDADPPIN